MSTKTDDRDNTLKSNAIEALTILFAYRIRSGGYDPDHSTPEDAAEAAATEVIEDALFDFADGLLAIQKHNE